MSNVVLGNHLCTFKPLTFSNYGFSSTVSLLGRMARLAGDTSAESEGKRLIVSTCVSINELFV